MSFLDDLAVYLNEGVDLYDLYPVDFDVEEGVSFKVDKEGSDEPIAEIYVKSNDATPVNALGTNFDYDDVYCDVKFIDINPQEEESVSQWVIDKLGGLGFDTETIKVQGMIDQDEVDDSESLSDIWDDVGEGDNDKELPPMKPEEEDTSIDIDKVINDLNSDEEDEEETK